MPGEAGGGGGELDCGEEQWGLSFSQVARPQLSGTTPSHPQHEMGAFSGFNLAKGMERSKRTS